MSVELAPPLATHVQSIRRCAQHLHLWLNAADLAYGAVAREAFVRAHPVIFGRAYLVTLHGYERWRKRLRVDDTVVAFARYVARRHERWLAAQPHSAVIAPCLLGTGAGAPCWLTQHDRTIN